MSDIRGRLDDLKIERDEGPTSRKWLWLAAVVVLLALAAAAVRWAVRDRPPEVRTATARAVEGGAGQTVLNASGYVTARRRATVSSKVTGKVVEVRIEEGMKVAAGQVLARLDDSNVRAALRLAEAELRSAEAAVEETRVRLDEARLELERVEELESSGVASRRELDRARAEVDSLAARLANQRELVEVAARAVAVQKQMLEDTIIRAPFDGIVVAKNAQPGEMISPVSAGGGFTRTGIGTVVDMSSLEIEVDVNEAYINRVQPGQAVAASLDAYPDWTIPSRVIAIIPTADRQRATVRVRVGFEELDPRILPDMGVKVAFRSEAAAAAGRAGVSVPASAVVRVDERDVVFVVRDGRVERRAVAMGEVGDDGARVLGGLAAGERVVLDAPPGLSDGDPVKEIEER